MGDQPARGRRPRARGRRHTGPRGGRRGQRLRPARATPPTRSSTWRRSSARGSDRGRQQGHDRRQALPAGLGAQQGLPPCALFGADHQDDLRLPGRRGSRMLRPGSFAFARLPRSRPGVAQAPRRLAMRTASYSAIVWRAIESTPEALLREARACFAPRAALLASRGSDGAQAIGERRGIGALAQPPGLPRRSRTWAGPPLGCREPAARSP